MDIIREHPNRMQENRWQQIMCHVRACNTGIAREYLFLFGPVDRIIFQGPEAIDFHDYDPEKLAKEYPRSDIHVPDFVVLRSEYNEESIITLIKYSCIDYDNWTAWKDTFLNRQTLCIPNIPVLGSYDLYEFIKKNPPPYVNYSRKIHLDIVRDNMEEVQTMPHQIRHDQYSPEYIKRLKGI